MDEQGFQIVVNGQLTEGADPETAKANVAKLFKTSKDKVEPMFSGQRATVKKGLDEAMAKKYQAALKNAGLIATVEPTAAATAPATPAPGGDLGGASIEAAGAQIDQTPTPAPANIDTSDISMGEAGETIKEYENVPVPDIDTSNINMGEVGETLVDYQPPTDPDINIDSLSMGEAGEEIMEHKPTPEPDIDISQLKVDDNT